MKYLKFKTCLMIYVLFLMVLFSGCTTLNTGGDTSSENNGYYDKTPAKNAAPLYYDFKDILVPAELKIDKKESMVYSTPTFAVGVLCLKGRVELNSLIDFFKTNMAKDNWEVYGITRYKKTVMTFGKPHKKCWIHIKDGSFTTEVEIWVSPSKISSNSNIKKSNKSTFLQSTPLSE